MVNDDDGGGLVLPMLDVSHTCFLGFLLGGWIGPGCVRYGCTTLDFVLDHVNIQLVVNVRIVFRLSETKAGNVDVVCISSG